MFWGSFGHFYLNWVKMNQNWTKSVIPKSSFKYSLDPYTKDNLFFLHILEYSFEMVVLYERFTVGAGDVAQG